MRKIFFGIVKKLFAVLLKLSPKETAVSLIIGSLELLAAILGPFGTVKKQAEHLMRGLKIRCFLIRTKSNTGKEKTVNMSIVPDCKSLQKN